MTTHAAPATTHQRARPLVHARHAAASAIELASATRFGFQMNVDSSTALAEIAIRSPAIEPAIGPAIDRASHIRVPSAIRIPRNRDAAAEIAAREEILEDVVLEAVPRVAVVRLELVAEALLVAAGHEARARGAADRRGDVALRAGGPFAPDRVDAGRRHPAVVARDVGLAEVVGQDEDDVPSDAGRVDPRRVGQVTLAPPQLCLVDDDAEAGAGERVEEVGERRGEEHDDEEDTLPSRTARGHLCRLRCAEGSRQALKYSRRPPDRTRQRTNQ